MQTPIGTIDPNETSGVELASLLNQFGVTFVSTSLGTGRPTYAQRGTLWVRETGGVNLELFMYSGTNDVLIGVINTTTNTFVPAGVTISLAGLGGVPNSRAVNTTKSLGGGGALSSDRTLQLVNDTETPPANSYYGTNASGVRGWHTLGGIIDRAGARPTLLVYGPGDYTVTFPVGVSRVFFRCYGATGGTASWETLDFEGTSIIQNSRPGGLGGRVHGTYKVVAGQPYAIHVGAYGGNIHQPIGTFAGNATALNGDYSFIYGELAGGGSGSIVGCDGGFGGSSISGNGASGGVTVNPGENITTYGVPPNPINQHGHIEIIYWA